jgi:hypothetical protein
VLPVPLRSSALLHGWSFSTKYALRLARIVNLLDIPDESFVSELAVVVV